MNKNTLITIQNKQEFIGFMAFFYLLPILLLYSRILPFGAHNIIIPLMGLVVSAYTIEEGVDFQGLGFTKKNFWPAMLGSMLVSMVIIGITLLLVKFGVITPSHVGQKETFGFILFYILVSAPVQEFIFRSVMDYEFQLIFGENRWLVMFFSAVVFALAHVFYRNIVVIVGTFVLGLLWAWLFSKYRSFWPLALSHAIVGVAGMVLGII